MFGLLATIISAIKGHKTFAWVVGIWTVIALLVGLSGSPEYAIAPGALFFFISITMKNLKKLESQDSSSTSRMSDNNRVIFYCQKCGFVGSDYSDASNKCLECNSPLIKSNISASRWYSMSEDEKNACKRSWGLLPALPTVTAAPVPAPQPAPPPMPAPQPVRVAPSVSVSQSENHGFCMYCGKKLPDESNFCPFCGGKLNG